ncbi:MAG TPA: alcohol dehydrogenase catalytic domain-containing protein [Acidimicrobiales bacterium]|nr:alcohol dehydrogenase catalytic domain-containing protein [Acidimicrobiales bacterium]
MRGVVLHGERDVRVDEVDDAVVPGPDGLLLRVERTAICGSDLHLYHGGLLGTPGVHLGHEFIGTVEDLGGEVHSVRKGDRVLVSGVIGCGRCESCRAGDPILCRTTMPTAFGTSLALHGGQAEAVGVPAADASVLRIPDEITDEQAVLLTDILPTGFLGARRADIEPGDTVVVIGLGPVGVFALQCAQLYGPARILAVDMVPDRLARAAQLGAEPIDATGGNTVSAVLEATGGRGADAVIEAVGADQSISDAIFCAAAGATVSVIGVSTNLALPLPMPILLFKKLTLRSTYASIPSTWPHLVPLVASGRLHPEEVFTHRLGLSEAPEAYRIFDAREDGVLKVLLDPTR